MSTNVHEDDTFRIVCELFMNRCELLLLLSSTNSKEMQMCVKSSMEITKGNRTMCELTTMMMLILMDDDTDDACGDDDGECGDEVESESGGDGDDDDGAL